MHRSDSVAPFLAKRSPLKSALFLFSIMFGVVMAIRTFAEKEPGLPDFRSFRWGDRIGFPLFGFLAARELRGYKKTNKWFDQRNTQILFGTLWGIIGSLNYLQAIMRGTIGDRLKAPSEIYHTVVFGMVGAIITHAFWSVLLGTKERLFNRLLAVSPLLLWVGGVIADIKAGR